jgi:5-methylcytosine-specific restriction protein A
MIRFCSAGGCSNLIKDGRHCSKHAQAHAVVEKFMREPFYDRAAWRRYVRPRQLRHFPMCNDCPAVASEVHHIDGTWRVTRDWRLFIDENNLMSCCHSCHSKRTFAENQSKGVL